MSPISSKTVSDGSGEPLFIEHHVQREQGEIHARDYAGAGPAFVLMHGLPDNSHIYNDLIPYLVLSCIS